MRSLYYSFIIIIVVIFFAVAPAVYAQQIDSVTDASKYDDDDIAMLAAIAAGTKANEALAELPVYYQETIKKNCTLLEQIKSALQLANKQFDVTKQIPFGSQQSNAELKLYHQLIDYTKFKIDSIVENRFNKREYRLLCKAFEVMLREHLASLEIFDHTLNEKQTTAMDATILRMRQYRIEVLNRVFGNVVLATSESASKLSDKGIRKD